MNLQSKIVEKFGGTDKVLHIFAGFGMASFFLLVFTFTGVTLLSSIVFSIFLTICIALAKEYFFDEIFKGTVDFIDAVVTVVGGIAAILLFLSIILISMIIS